MKELKKEFMKICAMEGVYDYERLVNLEVAKMDLDNNIQLFFGYESRVNGRLSFDLMINGEVKETRYIVSFDELLTVIKEYKDPADPMAIIKNFSTAHCFEIAEKEIAGSRVFLFPKMSVWLDKNSLGTEYLIAVQEDKHGRNWEKSRYIQSVKELNKFYKTC